MYHFEEIRTSYLTPVKDQILPREIYIDESRHSAYINVLSGTTDRKLKKAGSFIERESKACDVTLCSTGISRSIHMHGC